MPGAPRESFAKVRREHVDAACERVLAAGVQRSGSYFIRYRDVELPAKRVLREAVKLATGAEISADQFSGGVYTARILEALGCEVVVRN